VGFHVEVKMSIKELRKKIDAIDKKIVGLIDSRTEHVLEIGSIKKKQKKEIFSPGREKAVYARIVKLSRGHLPVESLKAIYREIMSAALALEKDVSIAYLGPKATFAHLAARKKFGASVKYSPADSIQDIFLEVERGYTDYGVVPIENSIEGAVTHTLDMFIDSTVKICSEVFLNVSHCLLSRCGLEEIKRIYSHPQVFGQCRTWLRNNFPKADLVEITSTARAAEIAAAEKGSAALAGYLAAEIYGLNVLQRSIEDSGKNETRFLVIGNKSSEPTGEDKTSIIVSVADKVGALYSILNPFKKHKINLTKIESRPSKKKAWEYYFFIDFTGHVEDENVTKTIKEIERHSRFVKHLGSYPAAK
jgi:chorismate mutase/prephenate dehydratase